MPDFSNARVGDPVWSDKRGWGKIVKIGQADNPLPYLIVTFSSEEHGNYYYCRDGRKNLDDVTSELHWDKIHYEEPKLLKQEEGWVDFEIWDDGEPHIKTLLDKHTAVFASKEDASRARDSEEDYINEPVKITWKERR